jgi:hypothetical protein
MVVLLVLLKLACVTAHWYWTNPAMQISSTAAIIMKVKWGGIGGERERKKNRYPGYEN